jgi:tRNA U34 5-methylaminomethyl-2-thiouridine-forming methyltransferase MnmC
LIITSDGSHTLYVPELKEHYHSIHGAVQESTFVFINNGFKTCMANPLNIFELGFGTGLNALLTAIESIKGERMIRYTSFEKYPVSEETVKSLNHSLFAGKEGKTIYNSIHSAPWNISTDICRNFQLLKIMGDFTADPITGSYDLIYFDAFGPDKQPEIWTDKIFEKIASVTNRDGIFVTYSAKGAVKRSLRSSGFKVSLLPGPPGKRQMIRAVKI